MWQNLICIILSGFFFSQDYIFAKTSNEQINDQKHLFFIDRTCKLVHFGNISIWHIRYSLWKNIHTQSGSSHINRFKYQTRWIMRIGLNSIEMKKKSVNIVNRSNAQFFNKKKSQKIMQLFLMKSEYIAQDEIYSNVYNTKILHRNQRIIWTRNWYSFQLPVPLQRQYNIFHMKFADSVFK